MSVFAGGKVACVSTRDHAARYDDRAAREVGDLRVFGAAAHTPRSFAAPYLDAEWLIRRLTVPGSRFLDIGCGTGGFSVPPALDGASVVGVDASLVSLRLAMQRQEMLAVEDAQPSLSFLAADIHRLPFADATFDVVTSYGVLSYLNRDVALREIRRVLRPGGSMVVVDTLPGSPPLRWWRQRHVRSGREAQETVDNLITLADIEEMRRVFDHVEVVSMHGITTLLSTALRRIPRVAGMVDVPLRVFDAALLRLPFMRRWAWKVVLHLRIE